MTTTWDETKIVDLLCEAVAPHVRSRKDAADDTPPRANIDVLITFDADGVSSHPNHKSLYHGARAFLAALVRGKPGWRPPVDLYTLTSVNVARKYSSVADVAATAVTWALGPPPEDPGRPGALVFMSSLVGGEGATLRTAWKAMTEAHASQMRWFRYGWITMSRYMVMNDLRLEGPKAG